MKKTHGFTLVELLIILAIIAVVGGMALPAFKEMIARNRLMTNANDIVATFYQARSEAIKQSRTVSIVACKPDCGTSADAQNWSNGWQITIVIDGTETVVGEHGALANGMTTTAKDPFPFNTSYAYSPQGRLNITARNAIKLCDNDPGIAGRLITLEPIGHISVTTEACN